MSPTSLMHGFGEKVQRRPILPTLVTSDLSVYLFVVCSLIGLFFLERAGRSVACGRTRGLAVDGVPGARAALRRSGGSAGRQRRADSRMS